MALVGYAQYCCSRAKDAIQLRYVGNGMRSNETGRVDTAGYGIKQKGRVRGVGMRGLRALCVFIVDPGR